MVSLTPTTVWCSLVTSEKIEVTLTIDSTVFPTLLPAALVEISVESLTFQMAVKYQYQGLQHKDITETGGVIGYSSTDNPVALYKDCFAVGFLPLRLVFLHQQNFTLEYTMLNLVSYMYVV